MTTDFRRFRKVITDDCVVVDSVAEYTDKDGEGSHIASCDLYDFTNGNVSEITSYTVALGVQP